MVGEEGGNKGGDSGRESWSSWIVMRLPLSLSFLKLPARVIREKEGWG